MTIEAKVAALGLVEKKPQQVSTQLEVPQHLPNSNPLQRCLQHCNPRLRPKAAAMYLVERAAMSGLQSFVQVPFGQPRNESTQVHQR
jgi:hypothetical protein